MKNITNVEMFARLITRIAKKEPDRKTFTICFQPKLSEVSIIGLGYIYLFPAGETLVWSIGFYTLSAATVQSIKTLVWST